MRGWRTKNKVRENSGFNWEDGWEMLRFSDMTMLLDRRLVRFDGNSLNGRDLQGSSF